MNRFRDYSGFAVWFTGLGYIVMWPLTISDFGQTASAAAMCPSGAAQPGFLCDAAHAFMLPPGLHLVGLLASLFVTLRLLTMAIKLSLRRRKASQVTPSIVAPARGQEPLRSLTRVKPRAHFGLRGSPR
jgi:hypothetical protein